MENGKKTLAEINFDIYDHDVVYRSLVLTPGERFGAGLMFKPGNRLEYDNLIHPRFVLVIVLRGEGILYDENGAKFELRAGMCFKRIPGKPETLSIKYDNKWVEFFIEISPALYQALRSMRIIETKPLCENIEMDSEFFSELMRFKEQFKTVDERVLPLIVGDFAKILAACRHRCFRYGEGGESVLIDSACAFLARDFNRNCDMKSFCRRHGVGYESFRKIFKNQIGVSPWQYRIRRRLDLACAFLQNPEMQINEIALELGYSSAYDFSAQFKKHFKVSPARYRTGRKFCKKDEFFVKILLIFYKNSVSYIAYISEYGIMVVHQLPKLEIGVQFPLLAPFFCLLDYVFEIFFFESVLLAAELAGDPGGNIIFFKYLFQIIRPQCG